ncbi:MAG: hypothetical protein KatS3mg077_0259 [Candidatus Binatia bacterium]|nr:MAG: hypothetical protein KatS3mg077_0259 [Candidatus Binatia bacterium]
MQSGVSLPLDLLCYRPRVRSFRFSWFLLTGLCMVCVAAGMHASCRRPVADPAAPGGGPLLAAAGPALDPARLYVLLINGGGNREQNYRSHFLHLRHVVELLSAAGVPPSHFTIFSGDGEDPAPDLAVRSRGFRHRDLWLVEGSSGARWLKARVEYENSNLLQFRLLVARRDALNSWFEEAAERLRPGDTLFVFVTDHGTKNEQDLDNNFIVLWGNEERLSVAEFARLLAKLNPAVRVVLLMSQCFSGAFARLALETRDADSRHRTICGYFSSTKERPAYGCYPENVGKNNVGHAFHMLRAWARERSLFRAHDVVLATDDTPDVPLRTSDEYLARLVERHAEGAGVELEQFADSLLTLAWMHKQRWEPHLRVLDSIGHAYGLFSARSLAEISERTKSLADVAQQLRNVSRSWRGAWHDASEANWQRFLSANKEWSHRLAKLAPPELDAEARKALGAELLPALRAYTEQDQEVFARLRLLRRNARYAAATSYRMEVRQAALLRMRKILLRIAGLQYLQTKADPEEAAAFASLVACEDLRLPGGDLPEPGVRLGPPFPSYDEDVATAQAALPGWMGIQFRSPPEHIVRAAGLLPGAAAVTTVYPESPADAAGLRQGDILVGPPGKPFTEKGQVRSWIMMARPGERLALEVLRGERREVLRLVAGRYPLRWPSLPGPPKVGSVAPELDVTPYRGEVPRSLAGRGEHLLFFWATWCAACKASLAELMAFAETRGVQVVAISDEPREELDRFFQSYQGAFPSVVAADEFRKAFVAYGISGTPTFVLVDPEGRVSAVHVGYDSRRGLPFPGWSWKR